MTAPSAAQLWAVRLARRVVATDVPRQYHTRHPCSPPILRPPHLLGRGATGVTSPSAAQLWAVQGVVLFLPGMRALFARLHMSAFVCILRHSSVFRAPTTMDAFSFGRIRTTFKCICDTLHSDYFRINSAFCRMHSQCILHDALNGIRMHFVLHAFCPCRIQLHSCSYAF